MTNNYSTFQIIIPTRDSCGWIADVLGFYRRIGYAPLIVVDQRTKDNTREIIQANGFSHLEFCPNSDYPEAGMLEFAASQCERDWILRLDDDELPSDSLLVWVRDFALNTKNQAWFIPRREIFNRDGKLYYSRSFGRYPLESAPKRLHPMARLFNRKRVKFHEELHTTGLKELKFYNFAPDQCFIAHLNCLINPFNTRIKKIKHYESIKPGSTWQLSDEYLPELFTLAFHNAANDGLAEFEGIFNSVISAEMISGLTNKEHDLAINAVKDRAHRLLREQNYFRLNKGMYACLINADDLSWIDYIPRFAREKIIKFLCTILPIRKHSYRDALWNYHQIYDKNIF